MDYLVTIAGLLTLAAYIWSLQRHFVAGRMPPGARLVSVAVLGMAALCIILVFFFEQPLWAQIAGFVLQLGAGALFAWAIAASRAAALDYAFTSEKPRGLVETGPYRHIRHPFYASYILFWTGWTLATWSLYALAPLAILTTLYTLAARAEERKFAATPMAGAYAAYKQRTGFFWPRLRRG